MILNLVFSHKTSNPLYVSGRSFIENKIVKKVFAQNYIYGKMDDSKVPRNDNSCLEKMISIVEERNPRVYTGPDYLGAHTSLREINALFPSRFWDADLIIADVFETKTLGAFGDSGWIFNKEGLRRMTGTNQYVHLYSCGKVSAFIKGTNRDSAVFIDPSEISQYESVTVATKRISMDFRLINLPEIYRKDNPDPFITASARLNGTFKDKVSFWVFEEVDNRDNRLTFVNYLSVAFHESLDKAEENQYVKETFYPRLDTLEDGDYRVFWGMGDLLDASETYLGTIKITSSN